MKALARLRILRFFIPGLPMLIMGVTGYFRADALFDSRMNDNVDALVSQTKHVGMAENQTEVLQQSMLALKGSIQSFGFSVFRASCFTAIGSIALFNGMRRAREHRKQATALERSTTAKESPELT